MHKSKQVASRDTFMREPGRLDYVPLTDLDEAGNQIAVNDLSFIPPAEQSPGDPGTLVPGIDAFTDASNVSGAASTFANIHFPYNSSLLKDKKSLDALIKMANYFKNHPNTYLFVEGHADERGAEAYNLALGSRRANSVRNILIKEGVNPEHLFTISYGKERPIAQGHDESVWKLNRRAQFKMWQS